MKTIDKDNLIFCKETNNLYFIAGYISPKLSEINEKAEEFKALVNIQGKEIYTTEITKSRRYKNMQVYWVNDFVCNDKDIFQANNGWEFLTD